MPITEDKERKHKISRSSKLRKYASVYKSYVRKSEQSKIVKSPRISRRARRSKTNSQTQQHHRIIKKSPQDITNRPVRPSHSKKGETTHKTNTPKTRKSLNAYQKFVQKQSKHPKYADVAGKNRLKKIAEEWRKMSKK